MRTVLVLLWHSQTNLSHLTCPYMRCFSKEIYTQPHLVGSSSEDSSPPKQLWLQEVEWSTPCTYMPTIDTACPVNQLCLDPTYTYYSQASQSTIPEARPYLCTTAVTAGHCNHPCLEPDYIPKESLPLKNNRVTHAHIGGSSGVPCSGDQGRLSLKP